MTDDDASIAYTPSAERVRGTNVHEFMRRHGIPTYDELLDRTTGRAGDHPESPAGIEWFWDDVVEYLDIEFYAPYDAVRENRDGPQFSTWYPGGELNISHNTVDRHGSDGETADRPACIWEGEAGSTRVVSYRDLLKTSNQVANALAELGVGEGDRVGLLMPMLPEVAAVTYGVFKVGGVLVPIFSGFGADAVANRLSRADCSVLFTVDGFFRRGRPIDLLETSDRAVSDVDPFDRRIVFSRIDSDIEARPGWDEERDVRWADAVSSQPTEFETLPRPATAPSTILFTSGTTGPPKGTIQTHAGQLVKCAKDVHFDFDHRRGDRFFWVTDPGWVMGSWTLIGNHALGGTVVMYEGAPDHPDSDRYWRLIEDHSVSIFGISPTVVRALRKRETTPSVGHDLSSLRILGSTGEPWDDESWCWFHERVGDGERPIVNVSGGTEVGGHFLSSPPVLELKPSTVGKPSLGIDVDIVDDAGESVRETGQSGFLVLRDSCPSMTKSLLAGDERYVDAYWSTWEDCWDHGDWAVADADGQWFVLGRADDVITIAGKSIGPAEIEDAVVEHEAVASAAAVAVPDDVTGEAIVVFAVTGRSDDGSLGEDIRELVAERLGNPFRPREVEFVEALPLNQSGKVVRRALRNAYMGEEIDGVSDLDDSGILEEMSRK